MSEFFLEFIIHLFKLLWDDHTGRQVLLGLLPLTFLIGLAELALDLRRDRSTKELLSVLAVFVLLVASLLFSFQHFPA